MKLSTSFLLTIFPAAAASIKVQRDEASCLRRRELASAGGSINVPTCFSKDSKVHVYDRGIVDMQDLKIGDRIFTGESYEMVYSFAHMDKDAKAGFVQIRTVKGNTMEATGAHLVFVDGTSVPLRADAVQVSDILEGNVVTKIGVVTKFVFKRL